MSSFTGGGSPVTTVDEISCTSALEYDAEGNLMYLGRAPIGSDTDEAVWQIRRFTYDESNLTNIKWADGVSTWTKVWDNRASYAYS